MIGSSVFWEWPPRDLAAASDEEVAVDDYISALRAAAPSGALWETYPRAWGHVGNSTSILVSGRVGVNAIWLKAGWVVNAATFFSGNTALAAGTHQWAGLWGPDLSLKATTEDHLATAWVANTAKTFHFDEPYTVPVTGLYYLGLCVVATTVPALTIMGTGNGNVHAGLTPRLCGHSLDATYVGPDTAPDPFVFGASVNWFPFYAFVA